MLDHIAINVSSYPNSKDFYTAALAPIGYSLWGEQVNRGAFGPPAKPVFFVREAVDSGAPMHIAFRVDDRRLVDAFHAAALQAGGADHGAPGLREDYHPNYYGAFVLDPDGHNIEVVCHAAEGS